MHLFPPIGLLEEHNRTKLGQLYCSSVLVVLSGKPNVPPDGQSGSDLDWTHPAGLYHEHVKHVEPESSLFQKMTTSDLSLPFILAAEVQDHIRTAKKHFTSRGNILLLKS